MASQQQYVSQLREEIVPCDESVPLLMKNYVPGQALPPTLAELYSKDAVETEFHALCVLLHNLMLESGYSIYDDTDESFSITKHLVTFVYKHPGCEGLLLTVTCNPLGPFIAINGCIHRKGHHEGQFISTQIKSTEFVNSFPSNEKPIDGREVYKSVKKLSHHFKEMLSHKALDMMRVELGLPPLYGILSLFPELLTDILSYLDVKSLIAVSMTCMRLNNIASDNNLWKACFVRDFKGQPTLENNVSWKEKYVFHYTRQKKAEQQRERFRQEYPPQPHFQPDNPFSARHPGMMPMVPGMQPFGMIGGEHDLNPAFAYGPFGRRGRSFQGPTGGPRFGEDNPLPGSRFDPFGPGTGTFRPGRGGGMQDYDIENVFGSSHNMLGEPGPPHNMFQQPGRGRGGSGFGGSGFGGFGGGGFM